MDFCSGVWSTKSVASAGGKGAPQSPTLTQALEPSRSTVAPVQAEGRTASQPQPEGSGVKPPSQEVHADGLAGAAAERGEGARRAVALGHHVDAAPARGIGLEALGQVVHPTGGTPTEPSAGMVPGPHASGGGRERLAAVAVGPLHAALEAEARRAGVGRGGGRTRREQQRERDDEQPRGGEDHRASVVDAVGVKAAMIRERSRRVPNRARGVRQASTRSTLRIRSHLDSKPFSPSEVEGPLEPRLWGGSLDSARDERRG